VSAIKSTPTSRRGHVRGAEIAPQPKTWPKKRGPLGIVWSPLALARLQEIRAFIAVDKPDAAERLATRIVSVVEALRIHPYLGRVGPEPGIRELIIGGTPYSILYRIRGNRLIISTISHASQSN
jgi:toxin ParE1/3/4